MSRNLSGSSSSTSANLWVSATGVLAHPNSPAGGGGPGGFTSSGPLGANVRGADTILHPQSPCLKHRPSVLDGHLILLASSGKKTKLPKSSPKPAPVKTVTLNLYGAFRNPWAGKPNIEKLRADPDPTKTKWHPSEDDWNGIFGGKGIRVDSFSAFLGIIERQKPGTIATINLFSHGNPELIGFGGTINGETGEVLINTAKAGGLDMSVIANIEMKFSGIARDGAANYTEPLGCKALKLRDRFVEGRGEIRLFLCNSGSLRGPLLQSIANAFQVTALGFTDEVGTGIQFDRVPGSRIERGYTYVFDEGYASKKHGFSHLIPKLVARKAVKTSAECAIP
jgi:hypothetical protein